MKQFYTKSGKVLGRGWSLSRCWSIRKPPVDHSPHSYDPEFAYYGPYFCPGYPEKKIYDTPPRKALN